MLSTRTLMLLVSAVAVAHCVVTIVRALRAWRRGEKYVGTWMDGSLLKGRAVDPRILLGLEGVFVGLAAYLSWAVWTGRLWSKELVFRTPAGWIDASEHAPVSNLAQFPEQTRTELREQAKHVRFLAVHPLAEVEGGLVLFTGLREFGSSRVDDRRLEEIYEEGFDAPSKKLGVSVRRLAQSITLVAGREIGTMEIELEGPNGALRVLAYVVPGDRQVAVLACMVPGPWFERYRMTCAEAAELNVRANSN